MLTGTWPSPSGYPEYVLAFDHGRERRLLVVPALFDEANKLRRFTVEVMRRLDAAGIDSFLPDLPGTHESLALLAGQSLATWREAVQEAARHFAVSHVLAIRGGATLVPSQMPGARYAPTTGQSQLRAMLRAQVLADKERGQACTRDELAAHARQHGASLAGHALGPAMIEDLMQDDAPSHALTEIAQSELGGPGIWLRAEPSHDAAQADKLATRVAEILA